MRNKLPTVSGEGVWLNPSGWSYGKSSQNGELKAWCTTREASRAAYRLLSGVAASELVARHTARSEEARTTDGGSR